MGHRLRSLLLVLAVVGGTVALFDLIGWFVVPPRLTAFSPSYRKTILLESSAGRSAVAMRFAKDYFRPDPLMGFDIRPGASGTEEIDNVLLPTFANSLGCFDRNEVRDFRDAAMYAYFAGDSHTWGNAEYDSKFATSWEKLTGRKAAKCGVTHTGQLHQFEKFKRFVVEVGKAPSLVFVGFSPNDPANDAAYPHSTVIDGYLVDAVYLRDGALVRPSTNDLGRVMATMVPSNAGAPSALDRVRAAVWVYSLSANVLDRTLIGLRDAWRRMAGQSPRTRSALGDNFYAWYPIGAMKASYATDLRTERNRVAIAAWAAHARDHGYRLVFLLIPPRSHFADPDYFQDVRGWLERTGVEYLDLAATFRAEHLGLDELYWPTAAYWSSNGNVLVGRLLAARY